MIAELVGRDENCIKYIDDRHGHDIRYAVSSKKAQRELGWTPVFSLQQGLSEVVVWYRNHVKWWGKRTHANKV
jgi:dTDP-glucose 4,6-dehydratase